MIITARISDHYLRGFNLSGNRNLPFYTHHICIVVNYVLKIKFAILLCKRRFTFLKRFDAFANLRIILLIIL